MLAFLRAAFLFLQFMKNKTPFLLLMLINFSAFSQIIIPKKDYVPEARHPRYSFSISLISGANSSPVSFGIYRQNPDSTTEIIFLTQDAFLRQASGHENSRANPEKINYFNKYGIDTKVLDQLWKLKYEQFPYENNDEFGWGSSMGVPSEGQFSLLSNFGIQHITDVCFGENVWLFLQKVSDPVWQGQYQQMR